MNRQILLDLLEVRDMLLVIDVVFAYLEHYTGEKYAEFEVY